MLQPFNCLLYTILKASFSFNWFYYSLNANEVADLQVKNQIFETMYIVNTALIFQIKHYKFASKVVCKMLGKSQIQDSGHAVQIFFNLK